MTLSNSESIFEKYPLFQDTDGDGYPDRLALRIVVHPGMEDSFVWSGLINLCARLAFEVVALRLPVIQRGTRPTGSGPQLVVYPPGHGGPGFRNNTLPAACWHMAAEVVRLCGTSGGAMMDHLNSLAAGLKGRRLSPRTTLPEKRSGKRNTFFDLLDLAGLYETPSTEPRARRLNAAFSLPEEKLSFSAGVALCDLAARLALDATELALPLASVGEPGGDRTLFLVQEEKSGKNEIRLLPAKGAKRQTILLKVGSAPLAHAVQRWASWSLAGWDRNLEASDSLRDHVDAFRRIVGSACVHASHLEERPRTLYRRARWKTEAERVFNSINTVPEGHGPVHGIVFVSKPWKRRKVMKSRLEKILRRRGYEPELTVLNAYKPGLSWLLEVVLPCLKRIRGVASLQILYLPFESKDNALEMRSRWLQELFPGPDILGGILGINFRNVRMACRRGLKSVYEVRAFDPMGRVIFSASLSPPFSAFPYLFHEPEFGHVHPSTGGIVLKRKGEVMLDVSIPTDRERFWHTFQSRWLPLLDTFMAERLKTAPASDYGAFWEEVSINVSIEETCMPLGVGEERIAPMEALHEDIYFVLLKFFTSFARRHGLPPSFQFGRILPKVKARPGAPKAALKARPMRWRTSPGGHGKTVRLNIPVTAATLAKGGWNFEMPGPAGMVEGRRLTALARSLGFKVSRPGNGTFRLKVKSPRIRRNNGKALTMGEPPADRLLRAGEVTEWVRRLGRSQCVRARCVSRSLQGRPIYALEALSADGDSLVSVSKMRLLKPTLFFNARHHANEISSTNATLRMAWRLSTTRWGRDILRHVNVVCIPMENVDGVATFEELLPSGKGHILHAARYNALGAEFYGDYFEDPPRFPEAKAKAGLWRRWLPDVMVDHHGVPDHEWNQPFSGYAPFQFREFWIPRNFVYVCVPFIDDETHPGHATAVRLADIMRRSMKKDKEIAKRNLELADRYRRYARGPEPDVFPPSKGEPLLVLPPLGRTVGNNFAVRSPEITRSEIIVEVPDEVASGKSLEMCVQAHLNIEEALLRACRRARGSVKVWKESSGSVHLAWTAGKDIWN